MTVRVQVELSDEEDNIVEIYRSKHNKKTNEEAIKEIVESYKPLSEYKKKNDPSWQRSL